MSEREKMAMWAAWMELNAIRARDGVPRDFRGHRTCVDEDYFSRIVDELSDILGDDAKPWPAKRWLDQDGSFQFGAQQGPVEPAPKIELLGD